MKLSDQIIEVLDDLCSRFGVAIDWTQENIIPTLSSLGEKYIRYEVATSIAWCVFWIAIASILLLLGRIFHKKEYDDLYIPFYIVGAIAAAIAMFVVAVQAFDIIECITIPEKTIIEYLIRMIKPHL